MAAPINASNIQALKNAAMPMMIQRVLVIGVWASLRTGK